MSDETGWVLTIPERVNNVTRVLNVIAHEAEGAIMIDNTITPDAISVMGTCPVPDFLRRSGLRIVEGIPKPGEMSDTGQEFVVWLFEGKAKDT